MSKPTLHDPNARSRKADLLRAKKGRPAVHGERMTGRTLALPPAEWRALDDAAHELRITTAELIRRRLGIEAEPATGARRHAKGG